MMHETRICERRLLFRLARRPVKEHSNAPQQSLGIEVKILQRLLVSEVRVILMVWQKEGT